MPAYYADDVEIAKVQGKTAVIFGFQNPSPIEDDIGLIEILHRLGGRFMQLSYNNQSLLAIQIANSRFLPCFTCVNMAVYLMSKKLEWNNILHSDA